MMKRMEQFGTKGEPGKKKTAALCMAAVLLALGVFYTLGVDSAEVTAGKRELPIYSVARDDGKISISFDAAWGRDQTENILDILDEYDVKTTFFLVDIWTQKYPELVKEIAARGHEIGNHSASHPQMSKLSREQISRELSVMSDHVEELIGKRPTLFRPPYGDYNDRVVTTARADGYEVIQWSVDSLDWKNVSAQSAIDRATKNIKSGDIVLFHNDAKYVTQALPEILKCYQEKGLKVVPISELLLEGEWTIDSQGKQQPVKNAEPTKIPEVEQ